MSSEEDLLALKLKEGDIVTFEYIFNNYYSKLLQLAFRFVADEDVSRDIVQEAFIALWDNRNNTLIRSVKNYLFTLVKNKSLAHVKHIGVRDKNQFYIFENYLFDNQEQNVFEDEIKSEIILAVEKLPKEMKRIFRAKYIHGLTVKEIAEDFDLSPNTVSTQIKRARKKIKIEFLKQI